MCGEVIEFYGDHCLVCSCGGDRTKRHHLLRNETFFMYSSAGLSPELEKPSLLQPRPWDGAPCEDGSKPDNSDARRPADVYLPRFRRGTAACLDFAVTSGLRSDVLHATLQSASAPALRYEDFKENYLNTKAACEAEGMQFIPMIAEACGGSWGPQAHKVWSELAKSMASATGDLESTAATHIFQNMGFILHKENARAILRRTASPVLAGESLLAAAATLADTGASA